MDLSVKDIQHKFNIPNNMCYKNISPLVITVDISNSKDNPKHLYFYSNGKVNYSNGSSIKTLSHPDKKINEQLIIEHLLKSEKYRIYQRKIKLKKLENDL